MGREGDLGYRVNLVRDGIRIQDKREGSRPHALGTDADLEVGLIAGD
jgi:hypothetical protein